MFPKDIPVYTYVRWNIFQMILTCACECIANSNGLNSVLRKYDVVNVKGLSHRIVKRSTDGAYPDVQHVEFDALDRHFHLYLQKKANVIGSDFKVVAVNDKHEEREVFHPTDNFYTGFDLADPKHSEVNVYYEVDGTISAKIKTPNDTYFIEPNRGRIPDQEEVMIAYRESDMKMEDDVGKGFCGYVHANEVEVADGKNQLYGVKPLTKPRHKRQRPSTPTKTKCSLFLVADYKFFRYVGQESVSNSVSFLIGLIDRINSVYMDTDFGSGFKGMGFEIKEVRVYEAPTVSPHHTSHFNSEHNLWDPKELLYSFARFPSKLDQICLGHLFTYQSFNSGITGQAFIASPKLDDVGGVCTKAYYQMGYKMALNCGWSTAINIKGRRLLTSEMELITAHALGHNWGSEPDPNTVECAPSSDDGGKYLMNENVALGRDVNNRMFSPCSRRSIGDVLASKHHLCFTEPEDAFCGNGRVEDGENCDIGQGVINDRCCDKMCKHKVDAVCSDINDKCCRNCQFEVAGTICHEASNNTCEMTAYCTGDSKDCPIPALKPNGETCLNWGTCKDGQCLSLCESQGLISCTCDEVGESCHYCCRSQTMNCTEHWVGDSPINIPEGSKCLNGLCFGGVCRSDKYPDDFQRIWDPNATSVTEATSELPVTVDGSFSSAGATLYSVSVAAIKDYLFLCFANSAITYSLRQSCY